MNCYEAITPERKYAGDHIVLLLPHISLLKFIRGVVPPPAALAAESQKQV